MIILEIYILKIDVYVMREMKNRLMLAILRMDLPSAEDLQMLGIYGSDMEERGLVLFISFLVLSLMFSFLELGCSLISCCTELGKRKHKTWIGCLWSLCAGWI